IQNIFKIKTQMYTVKELKEKHKKFAAAKQHFGIKAKGWQRLCDKLNINFAKDAEIAELQSKIALLEKQITENKPKSDLDLLLSDRFYKRGVQPNEIFESLEALNEDPEGMVSNAWEFSESVLKRRYYKLAMIYHPDVNGSNEQMINLNHAYKNAQAITKINQMVNEYASKK
ncbi:MAG: hypothetical protein PUP93_29105, partial [Rhizonema sp. NSF051]|nr:hypothetical protein [Rhizonema sp. NSF051]